MLKTCSGCERRTEHEVLGPTKQCFLAPGAWVLARCGECSNLDEYLVQRALPRGGYSRFVVSADKARIVTRGKKLVVR